jgi:predicted SprT family Zn-dependent metalloprotease
MNSLEIFIIESQIIEACELAGHADEYDKIGVRWSKRAVTTIGLASRITYEIVLAEKAWPLLSLEDRRETVFHEVAHLIAYKEQGIKAWGHTPAWRNVMCRMGYPDADRCHYPSAALEAIRRPLVRFIAMCKCGDHLITTNRMKRIINGISYSCRYCNEQLIITDRVVKV